MKKTLLFLLMTTSLFLSSCDKEDDLEELCPDCNFTCLNEEEAEVITNDCDDLASCEFKLHADSQLEIGDHTIMDVQPGDQLAFRLATHEDPYDDIADDEVTIILGFELDPDQKSFSLDDDQLKTINLHSQRICFCGGVPINEVTQGCLQGKQQSDGSWWVQGNLILQTWGDQTMDYRFQAQFMP